jgi:hypothetical protein
MPEVTRVGSLEIDQDLDYQRREWRLQRVGWVCMAVVVAAALAGLLGRGPLSDATAEAAGGTLRVGYNRFAHRHAPEELRITAAAGLAEGGELRLVIGRAFLDGVEVTSVSPAPLRVEAGPDDHTFVFRVSEPSAPVGLTLHYEPDATGRRPGRVGVAGRAAAEFRQFVYP